MIHPDLTKRLRELAGLDAARAVWSRSLPSGFSRADLLAELAEIRRHLPPSALRERFFGAPDFLASASAGRVSEWERSRSALVAVIQALKDDGFSLARDGAGLRTSFTHVTLGSEAAVLAIAISGPNDGPGYGVDLEPLGREISDAAFARFFREEEAPVLGGAGGERLDHWVLKEACFKAHPRPATTIVADYVVVAKTGDESYRVECRKDEFARFEARLGTVDEFRYAIARSIGSSG